MNGSVPSTYGRDLSWIHDDGFTHLARRAAPWILDRMRRAGIDGGVVVDLGCGSGRLAGLLGRAGHRVVGIDLSPSMIALARRNAPEARLIAGSFLTARLPRCDAVVSVGECLNYLSDPRNGAAARRRLFRRVHAALRPGGLLVFDILSPGRRPAGATESIQEGRGWAVRVTHGEDRSRKILTRRIVASRGSGNGRRVSRETHRLRLLRAGEVAGELRDAGFRVRVLSGYGRERLPGPRRVLVARKVAD